MRAPGKAAALRLVCKPCAATEWQRLLHTHLGSVQQQLAKQQCIPEGECVLTPRHVHVCCRSRICSGGLCVEAPTCANGIKDGRETGKHCVSSTAAAIDTPCMEAKHMLRAGSCCCCPTSDAACRLIADTPKQQRHASMPLPLSMQVLPVQTSNRCQVDMPVCTMYLLLLLAAAVQTLTVAVAAAGRCASGHRPASTSG